MMNLNEICGNCGFTRGSHSSGKYPSEEYKKPRNSCPGYPGTIFKPTGKYEKSLDIKTTEDDIIIEQDTKDTIPRLSFHDIKNNIIGQIFMKDGKFHFEGDVDESAKILFEALKELASKGKEK
ncbi:MAG: hypothetical protein GY834_10685 [Bacteroidetes bacterium]|nr:hypothetical protein [Bacteroidota bacterium]